MSPSAKPSAGPGTAPESITSTLRSAPPGPTTLEGTLTDSRSLVKTPPHPYTATCHRCGAETAGAAGARGNWTMLRSAGGLAAATAAGSTELATAWPGLATGAGAPEGVAPPPPPPDARIVPPPPPVAGEPPPGPPGTGGELARELAPPGGGAAPLSALGAGLAVAEPLVWVWPLTEAGVMGGAGVLVGVRVPPFAGVGVAGVGVGFTPPTKLASCEKSRLAGTSAAGHTSKPILSQWRSSENGKP